MLETDLRDTFGSHVQQFLLLNYIIYYYLNYIYILYQADSVQCKTVIVSHRDCINKVVLTFIKIGN